jgi:uncharacterized protein YfaS (alpha-2-macroglobulin family)
VLATLRRPLDAEAKRVPGRAIGVHGFASTGRRIRSASPWTCPPHQARDRASRADQSLPGSLQAKKRGVVVSAVDVGILNLTNYKAPAPEITISASASCRLRSATFTAN